MKGKDKSKDTQTPQKRILTRRIGHTTYKVSVHLSGKSGESLNDKIIRLIQNEARSGERDKGE